MEKLLHIHTHKADVNHNQAEIPSTSDKMLSSWKTTNSGHNACVCVYLDALGGNGSIITTETHYVDSWKSKTELAYLPATPPLSVDGKDAVSVQ